MDRFREYEYCGECRKYHGFEGCENAEEPEPEPEPEESCANINCRAFIYEGEGRYRNMNEQTNELQTFCESCGDKLLVFKKVSKFI